MTHIWFILNCSYLNLFTVRIANLSALNAVVDPHCAKQSTRWSILGLLRRCTIMLLIKF